MIVIHSFSGPCFWDMTGAAQKIIVFVHNGTSRNWQIARYHRARRSRSHSVNIDSVKVGHTAYTIDFARSSLRGRKRSRRRVCDVYVTGGTYFRCTPFAACAVGH